MFAAWQHNCEGLGNFIKGLNALEPRIHFTSETSTISTVFLNLRIYSLRITPSPANSQLQSTISRQNTFTYARGSSHIVPHTFRGIAIRETVRALRNSNLRAKFEDVQHQLLHRSRKRGILPVALRVVKGIRFSQRGKYLDRSGKENRASAPPEHPVLSLLQVSECPPPPQVEQVCRDPILAKVLPMAPFTVFKNHCSIGAILSDKRRVFDTTPKQATLQPSTCVHFQQQKF